MKRRLTRKSIVFGAGGVAAAGLLTTACVATAARATTTATTTSTAPSWHPVLSVANGSMVDTVVATGKTSGWAFLSNSTAYQRTGNTTWKPVAFPGTGGAVNVAGASSPSNVWAGYRNTSNSTTQLDRWNGHQWTLAKSFPGEISALSVLSPNDVWAFGNANSSGVFHYNGHRWAEVSATGQGGSALNDRNVYAFNGTKIEHFNGRTWSATNLVKLLPAQLTGHGPSALTGVLALASNNVYAIGEGDQTPRGGPGVVLHFNGHAWTQVAQSGAFAAVNINGQPLASDGRGGLWIEGQSFPGRLPELFHYSGGSITVVSVPGGAELNSVSRIPGTAAALAGGAQFPSSGQTSVVFQFS